MKMNSLYGTLLLACLSLVSCKKEEEAVTTVDPNKQIIIPRVAPIPSGTTSVQQPQQVQQQQTITPEQLQQMQMQQMQQQNAAANNKVVATKPGMNPPHGQPGHQCGIPVGAPLNSKPSQVPATPKVGSATTQQVSITPPTESGSATPAILNPDTAATATSPGMNPPHGQPGHVCGTPVGSPLPK